MKCVTFAMACSNYLGSSVHFSYFIVTGNILLKNTDRTCIVLALKILTQALQYMLPSPTCCTHPTDHRGSKQSVATLYTQTTAIMRHDLSNMTQPILTTDLIALN